MSDSGSSHLDSACAQLLASVAADHRQTVALTYDAIAHALRAVGIDAEPLPFGSAVSGLAIDDGCDIDMCLVFGSQAADMRLPPHQRAHRRLPPRSPPPCSASS